MQDPNADTQWNDVLRAKGIIPDKEQPEITEDDVVKMVEQTIQDKTTGKDYGEMNLNELNENEDDISDEDERMFEEYRRQRILEMKEKLNQCRFGDVREISKSDWVTEVNKAGDGIWVVVHVYSDAIPLCRLVNNHLSKLAQKFASTKFLKGKADVCIQNYPDKNLPTIFVYRDNEMKKQFIGPLSIGTTKLTVDELEWLLSETGAVETTLEENPRKQVRDVMSSASIFHSKTESSDDENDW
ncbi:phosducin-like protein 3 [Tubulanus polymorphus]|uniref:phosducin-like protein 3 n=1 Tax=Tubulanus polymorphus TaxID=672921 RepID=UPI003DA45921